MKLFVQKIHPYAKIPTKAFDAAGWDLYAIEGGELYPHVRYPFRTGLVVYPESREYFLQVVARSGMALNKGLTVLCGTIDPDYRGELKVVLVNTSTEPVKILEGDKIAQFLVLPLIKSEIREIEDLQETERGSKGFGSSG